MAQDRYRLTHITENLALELVQRFGGQEDIPVEYQTALWLIHMRLTEAEQDIAQLRARISNHAPDTAPSIGGDETGEF